MSQFFRNIFYCADTSGTMKWRRIWQCDQIECIGQSLNVSLTHTQHPIFDQNYYKGMTSVTCQRWINDQQKDIFCKFLKPLMDANSGWLIYEIDDLMSDKYIPKYNRGRAAFEGEKIQGNIREMLNAADFVTTTTDYLKQEYHNLYGVPLENIIAIPNLLPRYLFGDRYDVKKKIDEFIANKRKPRIGIVSSLSHFNVDKVRQTEDGLACRMKKKEDGTEVWVTEKGNEVPYESTQQILDDFDDIAQLVRDTVNDFQWVCFGYCPPQIADLAEKKKIEVYGGVPIQNYASRLENLHLQAIVAPIQKTKFNFSKSFIKYMEASAIGVPLYATNCLPYSRIMPEDQLFDTQEQLKEKLMKLKFGTSGSSSSGAYKALIEEQWKWLNSPCREGDFNISNFWLEDNLSIYIDLFRLKQKSLHISFKNFKTQYLKRKEDEKAKMIAQSQSGEAKITL